MFARKCDRCGKFYIPKESNQDRSYHIFHGERTPMQEPEDLCDEYATELKKWFKNPPTRIVEDADIVKEIKITIKHLERVRERIPHVFVSYEDDLVNIDEAAKTLKQFIPLSERNNND